MALARAYQVAEAEYAQARAEYDTWAEITPVNRQNYPLYNHGKSTKWRELFKNAAGRARELDAFKARRTARRAAASKRLLNAIGKLQTASKRIYATLLRDVQVHRRRLPIVYIKWRSGERVAVPHTPRKLGVVDGAYTVDGHKRARVLRYYKNISEGGVMETGRCALVVPERTANLADILDQTPMKPARIPEFPMHFAELEGYRYLTVPKDFFYWHAGNRNLTLSALFGIDKKERRVYPRHFPVDVCRIIVAMVRGSQTI